jgi:hypothetical protein
MLKDVSFSLKIQSTVINGGLTKTKKACILIKYVKVINGNSGVKQETVR